MDMPHSGATRPPSISVPGSTISLPMPMPMPVSPSPSAYGSSNNYHHSPSLSASQPVTQPVPLPALQPPTSEKRRRVSSARSGCCRTCRLRKVKCGGNPGNGPCSNCARLELACPFVELGNGDSSDKISRIRPSQSHTEAGTLRKRAQRACSQCHSQKTKCSGELPRCRRCESGGLVCEYTAPRRKFANIRCIEAPPPNPQETSQGMAQTCSANKSPTAPMAMTPGSTTSTATAMTSTTTQNQTAVVNVAALPTETSLTIKGDTPSPGSSPYVPLSGPAPAGCVATKTSPSKSSSKSFALSVDVSSLNAEQLLARKDFLLRHLDAFFENLYWMPCMGFFNPETAFEQANNGDFDPPTAAAVCAVSSFWVSPGPGAKEFSMRCLDEVEFFIFRNLHKFTDRVLLPYALILFFSYLMGLFAKVWQCFGFAARVVTGLQLNWEGSNKYKTFREQEQMRRVAWHFFAMDRMLAGGYEEYISNRAENIKIRIPCDEKAFWENQPVVTERLHEKGPRSKTMGLHGLNIRLVDINHRIQGWTKKLAQRAPMEPSTVMEDVKGFQDELNKFHSSIPEDLKISDHSISKYMAVPERVGYVYLHVHLAGCHIELYRFALPGILDSTKSEILWRLPQDFVESCRKQAVAHALLTGRFCVAAQKEVERLSSSGRRILAGDCTIAHMVTQSLRVFLISMQHNIYFDLTTDSTALLWRYEQPDEAHIKFLISEGLFRISEPWSPVLSPSQQVHASNKAMFAEFERTRQFADQKGTVGFSEGYNTNTGPKGFPKPHYPFENAHSLRVRAEEQRTQASNAAAADRWFSQPARADFHHQPSYHHLGDSTKSEDMEYGPPGVPMMLAVGLTAGSEQPGQDMQNMYETERDAAVLMQEKMWLSGGMMPQAEGSMATAVDMGSVNGMHMNSGTNTTMMFPSSHPSQGPSPTTPHFINTTQPGMSQPDMFMDGYATQYNTSTTNDSTGYMQHGNFN